MNRDRVIFESAARTATHNSSDIPNRQGRGLVVTIDVTAVSATPSVVFKIQAKDVASGKYRDVLESAAITAVGTTVLRVHPSLTAAANTIAKDMPGATYRILATHGDADSITYSVGAEELV